MMKLLQHLYVDVDNVVTLPTPCVDQIDVVVVPAPCVDEIRGNFNSKWAF